MDTTPRRDVPARSDTSAELTTLRIVALDAWADQQYAARIDTADHPVATLLYQLGHHTLTELGTELGRAPTAAEHWDAYSAALKPFGYRWDETTFTVQPTTTPTPTGSINDTTALAAAFVESADEQVRSVAGILNGQLVADMGGTGVLQIALSESDTLDEPFDRAGIDPPEQTNPRPTWWVELAEGTDSRISTFTVNDNPERVAGWITTKLGEMRAAAPAAQAANQPTVWFLSADELAATRTKLQALNQRAARKGFTGSIEVSATPATRSHTPGPGAAAVTVHGFDVTITGDPPHYQGWQFIAAVDTLPATAGELLVQPMIIGADDVGWPDTTPPSPLHPGERRGYSLTRTDPVGVSERLGDYDTVEQAEAARQQASRPGVVLRYLPGAEDGSLDHDSLRAGECDHCHTRRDRSSVLIVRHSDTGEIKQVGRSCVKDFLGWSTMPVLIDPEQADKAIERGSGIEGHNWDLGSVLTYSWAVNETLGWVPAGTAGDRIPSKDLVAEAISGHSQRAEQLRATIGGKLAEGAQMAPQIISDLTTAFAAAGGGYEANLAAILRAGVVHPRKHLGLAVSAVNAWHRQQEHAAADQLRAQQRLDAAERAARQRHVGTVGEPITMTGTVTVKRSIEGYRWNSPSQVLLVVDCGDSVAKMITTAAWAYQVKPGEQLSVKGTVKAHDTFNGVPQTVLKRPKQLPLPQERPEPTWETVTPVMPQSRFQEAPLAPHPPLARGLGI
jgi:hypothetical protein